MTPWSRNRLLVLLALLAENAGKVLTHRQILLSVRGPTHAAISHSLRVYMAQLRRKIEVNPANPKFVTTESAVGCRRREATA